MVLMIHPRNRWGSHAYFVPGTRTRPTLLLRCSRGGRFSSLALDTRGLDFDRHKTRGGPSVPSTSFLRFFFTWMSTSHPSLVPNQSLAAVVQMGWSWQTRNEVGDETFKDVERVERWTPTSDGPSFPSARSPSTIAGRTTTCATFHTILRILALGSVLRRTHATHISNHDIRRTYRYETTTIANRNPRQRSTTSTHVRVDAAIEQESFLALVRHETKRRFKDPIENTTTTDKSYVRRRPTTRACRTPRGSSWLQQRRKKHGQSHAHACRRPRGRK